MKKSLQYFSLIISLLLTTASLAASFNLDTLVPTLKKTTESTVYYTQYRYLNFNKQPLVTQGALTYTPPDTFTQTHENHTQTVTIEGSQGVLVDQTGRRRTFNIMDYPLISAPLVVLRAVMQGNTVTLKDQFYIHLTGSFSSWTLILTPKDPTLAKQLESIQLEGHKNSIYRARVTQTQGDVLVLVMSVNPLSQ